MAGQLKSAIVEIRRMYDSFSTLMEFNPLLPPDCLIESLEKFFGNGKSLANRSVFTSGNSRDQIKIMENLETAYEAYKNLSKTAPKSAPAALIKTMGAILTASNPVKVEMNANDDESDSSVEILDVESLQSSNNNNNEKCQDGASASNFDGVLVLYTDKPEARQTPPSTSFSTFHNQSQERVRNWVHGLPISIPTSTAACSSEQDENNAMAIALEKTTASENVEEDADEIASHGDSSLSSSSSNASSPHSIQNEQLNDGEIPVTPENKKAYACTYGCGKIFGSARNRDVHEKIHSGIGLISCDSCDRQFTNLSHYKYHQRTFRHPVPVQKPGRQRISGRVRCECCYKHFGNLQGLKNHQKMYPECNL